MSQLRMDYRNDRYAHSEYLSSMRHVKQNAILVYRYLEYDVEVLKPLHFM